MSCQILQLLDKMAALRRRDPTLPALQWNVAADALSRNGMEVNKTFYILQMDWLEPLYDFIFGEFGDVKKIDMENIKKMVTNKGDLESYSFKVRFVSTHVFVDYLTDIDNASFRTSSLNFDGLHQGTYVPTRKC